MKTIYTIKQDSYWQFTLKIGGKEVQFKNTNYQQIITAEFFH